MAPVSFQVIDGVDKGKPFYNLETPVTVGREEGNVIRLNDERVSRFHAKIQEDHGQVVLTDLDSTNGTCVNGEPVQLRLLRPGDRVTMGRSTLIFGTPEEIAASLRAETSTPGAATGTPPETLSRPATQMLGVGASNESVPDPTDMTFNAVGLTEPSFDVFERLPPKLPSRLSPAQAAELSEVIDYLHRALAGATETVHIPANGKEARLPIASWHRLQTVLSILAQYSRQVAEPHESSSSSQTIS